ncbi:hypothetical protein B0H66DRAFT_451860, partial [Apodospora peruviana]
EIPRPYAPGPIAPEAQAKFFNLRSEADYLMASLIPVLLATLLSIPMQIFTNSIHSMLPFRAMGYDDNGALAEDSLCLSRTSNLIVAPKIAVRFIRRFRDPLPLLVLILSLGSMVLVPLSSEVIRLEFSPVECVRNDTLCAYGLRKSALPLRAAEGLLVFTTILVLGLGVILFRWRSGVAAEPWSIASMASLLSGSQPQLRDLMRSLPPCVDGAYLRGGQISKVLDGQLFKLGYQGPESVNCGIGIVINNAPTLDDNISIRLTVRDPPQRQGAIQPAKPRRHIPPPRTIEMLIQVTALILTVGLLILILLYENIIWGRGNGFEAFMDSQSFGVRILFTSFGTAVSAFWDYHFSNISESRIYQRLSAAAGSSQTARHSILLSPPLSVFTAAASGLWRPSVYNTKNKNDVLYLNISLAAVLAKFTPILFSGIPFRNTVTWKMHEASTWTAVAVLSYMVLVLAVSLLSSRNRVYMPVKADSVAGCMYYVCDSVMLKDFEGLAAVRQKERDKLVAEMVRTYVFGEGLGV